ncbi:MAG: NAD-dependent malic enzyme, partial [Chloroflexaceae bacterium]|nr:NAD-dependent malic enzyme [Chloroflexaceae bacterium]
MQTGAYTITMRCQIDHLPGMLGRLTTMIGEMDGNILGIDLVENHGETLIRDFTIEVQNPQHAEQLVRRIDTLTGIQVLTYNDRVFLAHIGGKLGVHSRTPLRNRADLSIAYTPGVARVCTAIAQEPAKVYDYTIKRNSVAVITDGSAVLGLGNLGAEASLPVMEGKAVLFKEFANIDAYPIAIRSQDPETIIQVAEQIAPVFGGINLEDIAAPKCFEIEERLCNTLNIPVMHDDQHGTAVVTLAALWNALALVDKR